MGRPSATIIVLAALVVGFAVGIAWHEPKTADLPDAIRTWVGFVAIIGAGVALWQLDMQRRQLAEQKDILKDEVKRNKQRDALIAAQLSELEQRALTFERQQADDIDLRRSTVAADPTDAISGKLHMAELTNGSRRPIRNVLCRIQAPGGSLVEAIRVGPIVTHSMPPGARTIVGSSDRPDILLVRDEGVVALTFPLGVVTHPEACVTARFTDDAGLHWQLYQDLHLQKLDHRNDW